VYDEEVAGAIDVNAEPNDDTTTTAAGGGAGGEGEALRADMTPEQMASVLVPKYSRALAMGLGAVARYVHAVDAATLADDLADEADASDPLDSSRVVPANGVVHSGSASSSSSSSGSVDASKKADTSVAVDKHDDNDNAADDNNDSAAKSKAGDKQADAPARPTFLNPFTLRTLPHIIGTYAFAASDEDVGISYPG
jgi:hypothetical protein